MKSYGILQTHTYTHTVHYIRFLCSSSFKNCCHGLIVYPIFILRNLSIVVGADLSNNMLMKSLISIWIRLQLWWVRNKYTEFYQQIPLGDMYVILRMQGNILRRIKWSCWAKPYKFRISEKREITVREVGTASLPG